MEKLCTLRAAIADEGLHVLLEAIDSVPHLLIPLFGRVEPIFQLAKLLVDVFILRQDSGFLTGNCFVFALL